jgi:hypothetical protein
MTRMIKEARKRRSSWLLLLPVLALTILAVTLTGAAGAVNSHPALSTFQVTTDQLGANDVPGQKDLNSQGTNNTAESTGDLWVMWSWDDTSVSGNNTLDACTLFDTDADGNANNALCLTLGKSGSTLKMNNTTFYSCGDGRADRCSSTIASIDKQGSFCEIETEQAAPTGFVSNDTQAFCDIKVTALGLSSTTNLLNTCSYPSSQPNSDPSDCVLVPGAVSTTPTTTPTTSVTWSATLNDSVSMTPSTATGTVTFYLYAPGDTTCATPIWTSSALTLASGAASTSADAGSPTGGKTVSTAGTYHWKAVYSGASGFNGSDSGCGEAQIVSAATVS